MVKINDNYLKLQAGYLFPEIARRTKIFDEANPEARLIKLGIGDVTEPLPPVCVEAMGQAVDEMSKRETFHGYSDGGYDFLVNDIIKHDYQSRGCEVAVDEVFVSDGSKCDTGNILDILAPNGVNTMAVVDPVYPVYVDTNVMAGNTGGANGVGGYEGLVYLPVTAENNFVPALPDRRVDVIYLCYPNNPTGSVLSKDALTQWVDYARDNDALIFFDAAYEAFITDPQIPHSIFEIPGARQVAIEFRSFSKNAGFTGTRCAFVVVPHEVMGTASNGQRIELHRLWSRRYSTKFNSVAYIVQRGAAAVYSNDGRKQVRKLVDFYMSNAGIIRGTLSEVGMEVYGGVNAPYVWIKTPNNQSSWDFFDKLLNEACIVGTPGSGFGAAGEGYFRISAFNSRENVNEAMARIRCQLSI